MDFCPYFISKETEILMGDHQGNAASLPKKNLKADRLTPSPSVSIE